MRRSSIIQSYKNHPEFKKISSCNTLSDLEALIKNDKFLEIAQNAKNCVFSGGTKDSKLLIIGEAPGDKEDESGIPFCGRSGKYLDKFLNAQGFFRETNVYIANVVNWRPEKNRKPTDEEIVYCLPYLEKHIQLLNPKLIVTLGSTAAFSILNHGDANNTNFKIGSLVGKTYPYKNFFSQKEILIFVMYHPSYMMRIRHEEAKFTEYFSMMRKKFNEPFKY
jgi:DNA polymerase